MAKKAPKLHSDVSEKITTANIQALPNGGFLIVNPFAMHYEASGDRMRGGFVAACSSLDETLAWLKVNMARPVEAVANKATAPK